MLRQRSRYFECFSVTSEFFSFENRFLEEGPVLHSKQHSIQAFKQNTNATRGVSSAPPPMIPELLLFLLSDDVLILLLSLWVDVRSLATLDVAVSIHRLRRSWLMVLRCLKSVALDEWGHSLSSLVWLSKRGICA